MANSLHPSSDWSNICGWQGKPGRRSAKCMMIAAEILSDYGDRLAAMAADAERRLKGMRDLGTPTILVNPWPGFVRDVAECCRKADLTPTVTGDVYQNARPSSFKLVFSLNENLLGLEGGTTHGKAAFYAEIAKAMRSDGKPGKARR